jgi:hypothetical protein
MTELWGVEPSRVNRVGRVTRFTELAGGRPDQLWQRTVADGRLLAGASGRRSLPDRRPGTGQERPLRFSVRIQVAISFSNSYVEVKLALRGEVGPQE